MGDRWVNAKIAFTIPLDGVSVDDSPGTKAAAAFRMAEEAFPEIPDDAVGKFGFEDVEDGEPIQHSGDVVVRLTREEAKDAMDHIATTHGYFEPDKCRLCSAEDKLRNALSSKPTNPAPSVPSGSKRQGSGKRATAKAIYDAECRGEEKGLEGYEAASAREAQEAERADRAEYLLTRIEGMVEEWESSAATDGWSLCSRIASVLGDRDDSSKPTDPTFTQDAPSVGDQDQVAHERDTARADWLHVSGELKAEERHRLEVQRSLIALRQGVMAEVERLREWEDKYFARSARAPLGSVEGQADESRGRGSAEQADRLQALLDDDKGEE